MIEEKKLISACSPLAEHLHFETRVVNINQDVGLFIFPVKDCGLTLLQLYLFELPHDVLEF